MQALLQAQVVQGLCSPSEQAMQAAAVNMLLMLLADTATACGAASAFRVT